MFNGAAFKIDHRSGTLDLSVPASFMQKNIIDAGQGQFLYPTKPDFGGFLSYDILGQANYSASRNQQVGGFFTPGVFTKYGTLTSGLVARINNIGNIPDQTSKNQYTRLNTTWQTDFPSSMKTLRLGDAYNVPGMWGRSVNFGGIQWGTNFTTQPMFLTFPTLSGRGEATVPTAVNLMVNNTSVSSSNVNAGPFVINNIPTVNGAGNVNIVTTDMLGRQQVVNIPYYTSTSLLKKGLHNYSIEIGSIRQKYGINSNSYSDFMATGTHAFGVMDNFTSELRAEFLTKQRTVGVGANYLLGKIGVFNIATAASSSNSGCGGLAQLGFQRQSMSGIGFGFNSTLTSKDFTQVGYTKDFLPPILQNQVFFSVPIRRASLGVSYTQQNNRSSSDVNLLSLNYSQSIFHDISLNVAAFTNVYGSKNRTVMLTLVKSLDSRTTTSLMGNLQKDNNNGTLQITRSLPTDTGWGYDLLATQGERSNYKGALMGQTSTGTYTATLERQNKTTGTRLEASGGVVALGGGAFFTRPIYSSNSFAVVDVSGMPNVTVSSNNNPIGKTNRSGKAIVTNLLPYQNNKIEIQPNDLPLNTTISTTKITVAPYSNAGTVVKFPVKVDHPLVLTMINAADGKVVPIGATAVLVGSKNNDEYMVANDGEVYIPDIGRSGTLLVKWDDTQCVAKINYPKTKDPMPNLGKVECRW